MLKRKNFVIWTVVMSVTAFAAGLGLRHASEQPALQDGTASANRSSAPAAKAESSGLSLGGDFSLVDHTGRPVTTADFTAPHLLVFFGYTFCRDVCRTELQRMNLLLEDLGPLAARVQPIFISVDPERDTAKVLADYVGNFHPRLVGLTGTSAQVRAAAKKFGVYYSKLVQKPTHGEGDAETHAEYLVSHSSLIFLTGSDGRVLDIFQRDVRPEFMLERVRRVIGDGKGGEDRR